MDSQQLDIFPIIDDTDKEIIEFRYQITSYGADYPVDSLVKRIDEGTIFVPPFQRKFVWDMYEASKFIESLILGLPVPGIFMSREKQTNKLLIVDGQQRLMSLYSFYKNKFKDSDFRLQEVQKDLLDKRYRDLSSADKNRLDDSIIHSTIVRQDEPDDNDSSIYQIFERINSGGRPLSPQEIRACIYYGGYNELLGKLTRNVYWRTIFGRSHNERLKEEELIHRFFSLYFDLDYYEKPLKDFLNKRMSKNRNFELHNSDELTSLFIKTITFLGETLGKQAFKMQRGIHTALFDSVMIATAKRLKEGPIMNRTDYRSAYNNLLENGNYVKYIDTATSDEASVKNRINIAERAFFNLT